MAETEEFAYAKLNLSLDVLGKLPGDYHAMRMVMQTVSLRDRVLLETGGPDGTVTLRSNFGFLPTDGRNIAVKAAKAFYEAAGISNPPGLRIRLDKRIPVGAGMAGGSANAAAVLRGLNRLVGTGFSLREMEKLGETLGSDVPFCVAGGARLAEGRGEILSPLPCLPDCRIVICKPAFSIRTPDLFARIDARHSGIHPDTDGMIAALAAGDLEGTARRIYNVFEDVLPSRCSEVGVIKERLLSAGALGAAMTGTGSAVFGIFRDAAAAEQVREELGKRYRDCFLAAPVSGLKDPAGVE